MRLTLRTLLAYLDDILDPADAQELGQKIEQSEFASRLVHTIRSVTRKLRLGAPRLSGKGMGLDPNTVAEYLDNTLPPDRVSDFEKVCLESDVHLAEVASCHQILTLVVGEPADVDPALRERVRALHVAAEMPTAPREPGELTESHFGDRTLRDEPEPPPVEPDLAAHPVTSALETVDPRHRSDRPRPRWVPLAATVTIFFLLAVVVLVLMGPLDHNHPILGGLLARNDTPQPTPSADLAPESGTSPQSGNLTDTPGLQVRKPPADEMTPAAPAAPAADGPPPGRIGAAGEPDAPPDAGPPDAAAADQPPGGGMVAPEPQPGPDAPGPLDDPKLAAAGSGAKPEPGPAGDAAPAEDVKTSNEVGRYLSDQHVLARLDSETNTWLRLSPLNVLRVDDQLVALPTYRPQLAFSPGIQIVLVGPAHLHVQAPDAAGIPQVTLLGGKMLVVSDAGAGSALTIRFGTRQGQVTFSSPDALLALETQNYLPPGENPETFPVYHVWTLQAVGGELLWQDQGQPEPVELADGSRATLIDGERPRVEESQEKPSWMDAREMPLIDRDASRELEPLLIPKRPLSLSLQEQVSSRLVEVRALAIRGLGMLDQFEAFVDAWNDEDLRSYWDRLFEALRFAIARSPESAAAVRETFERLRGEQGTQMYRLLWGFSPQQLEEGGAKALVGLLSSDAIDLRALAFSNLLGITERSHMYRPEREPGRQKPAILKWHKTLDEGGIVYKTPLPVMPDRPVVPGVPPAPNPIP